MSARAILPHIIGTVLAKTWKSPTLTGVGAARQDKVVRELSCARARKLQPWHALQVERHTPAA